jgi:lysophospholipase L1-like esterase
LGARLRAAGVPELGIANLGLIGNRLLAGGKPEMAPEFGDIFGEAGVDRFERELSALPNVRYVVLRLGSNDIGFPGAFVSASHQVGAAQIIAGLQHLVGIAHARGIKVVGTTLSPFKDAELPKPGYYAPEKEPLRQAINAWMRQGVPFDALVDFDAVLRDREQPDRLAVQFDSGDHIHPNDAGYRALAEAFPIDFFMEGKQAADSGR